MSKYKLVCPQCGSDDILRDAYAYWDADDQQWRLHDVYDYMCCNDDACGAQDITPVEVPYENPELHEAEGTTD